MRVLRPAEPANVCDPPPPHEATETATWPAISATAPIPDSAYDTKSYPGEVVDKQTCLNWMQYPLVDAATQFYLSCTWSQAKTACPSGWRLPTMVELDSIVDSITSIRFPVIGIANYQRVCFLTRQLMLQDE